MKGFAAVFRKELHQYFATPIAYALMAVFWALTGYYFSFNVFFVNVAQMVNAFHNMSILLLLIMPLLTMRIFAEENRTGTAELLLTLPLDEAAIVAAKFSAALVILALMLAGTATALIPLTLFGEPDLGPVLGGYIGVLLMGMTFLAVGLFISSLCGNQLVAALLTWGLLVLLWYIDYVAEFGSGYGLTRTARHLSLSVHYTDLIRGVLPVPSVVYLCGIVLWTLTLTVQTLRLRRV